MNLKMVQFPKRKTLSLPTRARKKTEEKKKKKRKMIEIVL